MSTLLLLLLLLGHWNNSSWTGLCFTRDVFHRKISELPQPIAMKLCQMIGSWLNFIMQVQKWGALTKKMGPKTCQTSVDFKQLQTLIANVSGTSQDIQNRIDLWSRAIFPHSTKKFCELWSTIYLDLHVSLDPLKWTLGDHISNLRGSCRFKFLHALDIDQGLLVTPQTGTWSP